MRLSARSQSMSLRGSVGAGVLELLGFLHCPNALSLPLVMLPLLGALGRVPRFPEAEGFRLTHDPIKSPLRGGS